MRPKKLQIRIAKLLWTIAGFSNDWGNALMDLVGNEVYEKIAELAKISTKED